MNGAGRDSLRYDRAGNLIQWRQASGGPIWDYGYDALDRLVSVRRGGTLIARYGYDVLGQRTVKRVYSSVSGGTVGYTRFVYRGGQVGFETDSAGTTIGLKYTYGGTDRLLAITSGVAHYYVTTDKLGSVRALTKRDGTWLLAQRFGPYGELIARDTSATFTLGDRLRYGWTGREYDAETGFSFHRARYYLPTIRRWTQEDPIGYAGGGNLYAYVGGTPLEARDPSGLQYEQERAIDVSGPGLPGGDGWGGGSGGAAGLLAWGAASYSAWEARAVYEVTSTITYQDGSVSTVSGVRRGNTVIFYDDQYTRLLVENVIAESPTLQSEAASDDVYVWVKIGETAELNPGLTQTSDYGRIARVTLDPPDISDMLTDPTIGPALRANGGLTLEDVIGHEFNAHVFNYTPGIESFCPGCAPSPAAERENVIRRERGRPNRTF